MTKEPLFLRALFLWYNSRAKVNGVDGFAIYCLGRLVPCGRLYGQNLFLAGPRQGRPLTINLLICLGEQVYLPKETIKKPLGATVSEAINCEADFNFTQFSFITLAFICHGHL